MSTLIQGDELRTLNLGQYLQGQQSDFTADGDATYQVFTVTGGQVLITALWGVVDTVIAADGGTLALQTDPTTGDTVTIVEATDLGTTNTAAGTTLGVITETTSTANSQLNFAKGYLALKDLVVTTGEIEAVAASSLDGVVDWYCTWLPLTDGANVMAATGSAA